MNDLLGQGQLSRSSLERVGFIGELYDARNECLSSRSLFKSSLPPDLISRQDIKRMDFDYKFTENISDRFELFQIEGELQVRVLLGVIQLKGSGKFLTEENKSEKIVSCTLMCKILTVNEKLISCFEEIQPHVDLTALTDPDYTHVIAEVTWGANCLLSLESNCRTDEEKQKTKGLLEAEMSMVKKFMSVGAGGSVGRKDVSSARTTNIRVKVCADVIPEKDWPTTVDDFCRLVSDFPKLLQKNNNGRGKPLTYVMIPLSTIRKMAKLSIDVDTGVKKIDESFLMSIIFLFEEIARVKQKFHDTLGEMEENKQYVPDEDLKTIREEQQKLILTESDLKLIILDSWPKVKSGEKPLRDLIREIEKFKHHKLNLIQYEEVLDSFMPLRRKLCTIKNWTDDGITYLGKWDQFQNVLSSNPSCEVIVFVTSSKIQKANPELYTSTLVHFRSLASEKQPGTKYVVVDFDCNKNESFFDRETTEPKSMKLLGSKIITYDLYHEYLLDLNTNFVRLSNGVLTEFVQQKPGNRVELQMPCPNCTKACPSEDVLWTCFVCKRPMEYGFDEFYYCGCGRGPSGSYEYRCNHPKHGCAYTQPPAEFLQKVLSSLRPLKELNILVLGQSGAGKSTWINSIVNYLTYDSLKTAQESGVICTIPTSFTMYDPKTNEKHTINVGEDSTNENRAVGQSATQQSHTYSFMWDNRCVRLIDTPGLGDTRGIAQDKQNLENIIEHISHLKELHAVCILLKANENRLAAMFSYCVKELLTHLHRSVAKNVLFCFTNARSSFYSPGQTSSLLEKTLDGISEDLVLGHHNMFCLDNEAFLFLCSLDRIQHDEDLKSSFAKSWDISLKESLRLFNTVKTFRPHLLLETVSLVKTRNRVLLLSKPIAEISKTIQMNIATVKRKQKEIETSEMAIEDLSKRLSFTVTVLETENLERPRTVCTSPTCVEYIHNPNGVREVEYKTHCHPECYVSDVVPKTINNHKLRTCLAMIDGICQICGCNYENHMHITESQRRVQKQITNKNVERDLQKTKSKKAEIENFVRELEHMVEKYKQEQEIIINTSLKFGVFLRQNAISVYNDVVADYLQYLIKQEEDKPYKSDEELELLESLKETLQHYNEESKILEEIKNKEVVGNEMAETLGPRDVADLENQLYRLELTGESIRKSVESARASRKKLMEYLETSVEIETSRKKRKNFVERGWKIITGR